MKHYLEQIITFVFTNLTFGKIWLLHYIIRERGNKKSFSILVF